MAGKKKLYLAKSMVRAGALSSLLVALVGPLGLVFQYGELDLALQVVNAVHQDADAVADGVGLPGAGADDLPKLNLRAYDANSSEVMKAAGANAQFLPMDTALAGLREHRLNAFLTSGDGGAGRKLWDFLPYFAAINYAMPISIAFVRNEAFAALPEPMQREVLAAATETEQSQLALLAHRTTENYARMRDNGVHITEPAPASLIAALRTAATGTITAWEAQAGTDAAAIVEWAKQQ